MCFLEVAGRPSFCSARVSIAKKTTETRISPTLVYQILLCIPHMSFSFFFLYVEHNFYWKVARKSAVALQTACRLRNSLHERFSFRCQPPTHILPAIYIRDFLIQSNNVLYRLQFYTEMKLVK